MSPKQYVEQSSDGLTFSDGANRRRVCLSSSKARKDRFKRTRILCAVCPGWATPPHGWVGSLSLGTGRVQLLVQDWVCVSDHGRTPLKIGKRDTKKNGSLRALTRIGTNVSMRTEIEALLNTVHQSGAEWAGKDSISQRRRCWKGRAHDGGMIMWLSWDRTHQ